MNDRGWTFRLEDRELAGAWDLYFTYDLSMTEFDGETDVVNGPLGIDYEDDFAVSRTEQGAVGIFKMHGDTGSDLFEYLDWDFSGRYYDTRDSRSVKNLGDTTEVGADNYSGLIYKFGVKSGGS